MLDILSGLHAFLRWPVLVVAIGGFVHGATAWSQGAESRRLDRVLTTVFLALLDLQILLGVVLFVSSPEGRNQWPHALPMLAAAVLAHLLKRRWSGAQPHIRRRLLLATFLVPLLLFLPGLWLA